MPDQWWAFKFLGVLNASKKQNPHPCDASPPPLPCVAAVSQLCKSTDLLACRAALLEAILGSAALPEGEPEVAEGRTHHEFSFPRLKKGADGSRDAHSVEPTWLIWNMSTSPVLANHSRPSRVLFYRSSNPRRKPDTIVMYNNGHGERECIQHGNTVPQRVNDAGYDVMEFFMPLMGCNKHHRLQENLRLSEMRGQGVDLARSMLWHETRLRHDWFKWFDEATAHSTGKPALRFFVEPLLLAIAHARRQGYTNVVLVGLSGGAWQVLVAASLLANVNLTIPVAGVCRDEALRRPETKSYHYERTHMSDLVEDRQLYRMAALEPGRTVLQIYHARDACCCRVDRADWSHVPKLDEYVRDGIAGHMQTAITDEYKHAMHSSDIEIVLRAVALLRRGQLHPRRLAALPHDELASDKTSAVTIPSPPATLPPQLGQLHPRRLAALPHDELASDNTSAVTIWSPPATLPPQLDAALLKRPAQSRLRAQLAIATVMDLQSSTQECPQPGIVKWCHSAQRLAQALTNKRRMGSESSYAYAEVVILTDNVKFVERECNGSPHRGHLRVLPFATNYTRLSTVWLDATMPSHLPKASRYGSTGKTNGLSYLRKLELLARDEYGVVYLTDNDVDLVPAYDRFGSDEKGDANRSHYLGIFDRQVQQWPRVINSFMHGTNLQLVSTLDSETPINAGSLLFKPSRRVFDMACKVLSTRQFNTTHGFEYAGKPTALLDRAALRRFRFTRLVTEDTWDVVGGNADQGLLTYLFTMRLRNAFDLSLHCPFTGNSLCGVQPVPGARSHATCPIAVRHLWGDAKPWKLRWTCPAYFRFLEDESSFQTPCGARLRERRARVESGNDLPKGASRSCGGVPICVE